jgi:hypothetical protein
LELRDYLNSTEEFAAVYINIKAAQQARDDIKLGVKTVVSVLECKLELTFNVDLKLLSRFAKAPSIDLLEAAYHIE